MTNKRSVKLFVSYSHDDETKVVELLLNLKKHFKLSKKFKYELWQDGKLLLGDDFHEEIVEAVNNCDFGLLMTSVSFFTSYYINDHELPPIVKNKKALPVALKPISFERHDLKGLEKLQFFGHGQSYTSKETEPDKEKFIYELYCAIEDKVHKSLSTVQLSKSYAPNELNKENNSGKD